MKIFFLILNENLDLSVKNCLQWTKQMYQQTSISNLSERKTAGVQNHTQEWKASVTAVCCISEAGFLVPPALIFPWKRYKTVFCDRTAPGMIYFRTVYNLVTALHKYVNPSHKKKLPVLDNYISHAEVMASFYCLCPSMPATNYNSSMWHFSDPWKKALLEEFDRWVTAYYNFIKWMRFFYFAFKTPSIDRAVKSFQYTEIFP